MTDSENLLISRGELEDLISAVAHYQHMAFNEGNAWGSQTARDLVEKVKAEAGFMAYAFVHLWFGRNHQKIQPGDTVRTSEWGSGEFCPAEVLTTHTYGAWVQDENEAGWWSWHDVHRLDRLHTEPDFDIANYAAVIEHMGYDRDPGGFPDSVTPYFIKPSTPALKLVDHWPTEVTTGEGQAVPGEEPRNWDVYRFATAALGGDETSENGERAKEWHDDLVADALGTTGLTVVREEGDA
ncbi:hypothetical protein [Saccharothrix variisporea]|uniref:Uncharacterized protein n=1 Tax=Saccharothrix variisporea TaxID=543527 RepID=A0A495X1D9_9PSEU|nr:hypothetical protein [Saccharothrix variisporea]RKT67085.1 hypothetical protein DFJ66_0253 [Saccharothrix variisporea]